MLGRYAGYTQGNSEYSVKSLTEREAAKLLSCPRSGPGPGTSLTSLYSPCQSNIQQGMETSRLSGLAETQTKFIIPFLQGPRDMKVYHMLRIADRSLKTQK